jgi:WD40 repeat protein
MASTLTASALGIGIVDRARRHKGWNKTETAWQVRAEVSKSTLDRFWMQKPIKHQNFVAICEAAGVDWEQVVDLPAIEPTNITRKSNLAQVNQPVILELEEFGQQIFNWFGALDFKFEGLPRREGNYVEWVIQVPVRRSRFDRVLIRATIHEVGLSDLDSLRRGVAQLRVDEGWLVTNLWVSQSVLQALKNSDDKNLTCLTFDELIDQDADFTPYFGWLKKEINKIEEFYVPLNCRKGEFDPTTRQLLSSSDEDKSKDDIDFYIDRWLTNPTTEHVSILGEFGTGKTWFTLHYAWKCLQAYEEAKAKGMPRPRLPLVIRLRDYAKSLDVRNVMAGFFFNQHDIRLNHAVFDRLNQMGKLLLIFDGFDEMANKVDPQKMGENFRELVKVITPNSKVVLTCRTEHFGTAQAAIDNLHHAQIKFQTLELVKFDDEQIRAVLARRTNLATVEWVMANSQLLDLLRRAVMAEYVLDALPKLEEKIKKSEEIDISRVYLYAVWQKMQDIKMERTFTSLADKLYFLCELAWEMLSEDKMTLNYREFPDRLRLLFKDEVKEQKHLDHWQYDMMGQAMLIRNDDGDYSPAHRSLLEFFVAYKFAAELGLLADDFLEMAQQQSEIDENLAPQFYTWSSYWQREFDDKNHRKLIAPLAWFTQKSMDELSATFGKQPLTRAILDLLKPILKIDIKYRSTNNPLLDLIKSTQADDNNYVGGNTATLSVELNPYALEYQDVSGTNLKAANLVGAGLRHVNLSGSNLINTLTSQAFQGCNAIEISDDCKLFFTGHSDGKIKVWTIDGQELRVYQGHEGAVNSLVVSGNWLFSGCDDKNIKQWEIPTDNLIKAFVGHKSAVHSIAVSGEYIFSGSSDKNINQWEISTGRLIQTFSGHQDSINSVTLNTEYIFSGSNDNTVRKWEIATGRCIQILDGHEHWVSSLAVSGEYIFSGSWDNKIRKWEIATGRLIQILDGHQGWISSLVVSGEYLFSCSSDKTVKQWDISNGQCIYTFPDHKDWLWSIAVSDTYLLSGGRDSTVKKWDISTRQCKATFNGNNNWVMSIGIRDRSLFSGSNDNIVKQWDIETGECTQIFVGHEDEVRSVLVSGESLFSASDDGNVKQWDIRTGECLKTFSGHEGWVRSIVVSGESLFSGSSDLTVKQWDIKTGKCLKTFSDHQGWVRSIVISGESLFSGSWDRTVKQWDINTGECVKTLSGHQDPVRSLAVIGRYLFSGSNDNTIKQWDINTGECVYTFDGHRDWVNSVLVTENFLFSGSDDNTIKQWDINTGECVYTFYGHRDWVNAITISQGCMFSASSDSTIKKWNIATGECINTFDNSLCAGANITNVKGLTPAQIDSLLALGAIDDNRQ